MTGAGATRRQFTLQLSLPNLPSAMNKWLLVAPLALAITVAVPSALYLSSPEDKKVSIHEDVAARQTEPSPLQRPAAFSRRAPGKTSQNPEEVVFVEPIAPPTGDVKAIRKEVSATEQPAPFTMPRGATAAPPLSGPEAPMPGRSQRPSSMSFAQRPPQLWRSFPAMPVFPQQAKSDLEVELAPGVREPIVLAVPTEELTPEQESALASVASDFTDRVGRAASLPDDALAETWGTEQADADALYRILFGDAAYNQKSIEAALDSLGLPIE
jgi:hypothetical protein